MPTITKNSLVSKLSNWNPYSSFVTVSYTKTCGSSEFLKGTKKAGNKRDFEICKTIKVKCQVGGDYLDRLNKKLAKLGEPLQSSTRGSYYTMINSIIAQNDKDNETKYLRYFESKRVGEVEHHDENGKQLDESILCIYRNPKRQKSKPLKINCLKIENINSIKFLDQEFLIE